MSDGSFDLSGFDVSQYATPDIGLSQTDLNTFEATGSTQPFLIDTSGIATTATANPSLISNPGTLSMIGGPSLSTVAPNPQIGNSSGGSALLDISALTGAASQWGQTITSLLSGSSAQPAKTATALRTSAGAASAPMSNTTKLLLLVVAGIIVYLLVTME